MSVCIKCQTPTSNASCSECKDGGEVRTHDYNLGYQRGLAENAKRIEELESSTKSAIKDDRLKAIADEVQKHCDHGVTFDEEEAKKILGNWAPSTDVELGNPRTNEIRKRWPRGFFTKEKPCPKGCGYVGIYYASSAHYAYGDW
jgi:hypothetical protein